jgi:hypothetical protein
MMTDLTPRQLVDTITRSLKETRKRMAAKYRGAAAEPPAADKRPARGRTRAKAAVAKSVRRRRRG